MNGFVSLQTALRHRIDAAGGQPFAVLDFDNTCIVNDIAEATLAYMCRNNLLKHGGLRPPGTQHGDYHEQVFRRYYALLDQGDIRSASLLCAGLFAGYRRDEAEAVVRAAMDAEGNIPRQGELYGVPIAVGLAVRPALRTLIDFCRANDVRIWIVSASPEIAVRTAMQRFGLPGQLIALRNRMANALLSSEVDEPYPIGEGKVDCIKAFIDRHTRPLLAIGDSIYDLPMIEYADVHAVVDCNNALTTEARRRGWFVLPG
jgi:phosphoserine phosphatase